MIDKFSSLKGLTWAKEYDAIREWHRTHGRSKLLPPPSATIDVTNKCQLRCKWCNAAHINRCKADHLVRDEVYEMIKMLAHWGVKSICWAGGGEPTLHKDLHRFLRRATKYRIENGIATNGLNINLRLAKHMAKYCRFVGISIDASTPETYANVKGTTKKAFHQLKKSVQQLAWAKSDQKSNMDLTGKILITPYNYGEVLSTAKLAKQLGCNSFYARVGGVDNVSAYDSERTTYEHDIQARFPWDAYYTITQQLKTARDTLSDEGFTIHGRFDRVDKKLVKLNDFHVCWAQPLLAQICADGYVYTCIDKRMEIEHRMCHWTKLKGYWGSVHHYDHVRRINISRCPRCAFTGYQRIYKQLASDNIFRWFA